MPSHDDRDAIQALEDHARKLTALGMNRITAGEPGEQAVAQWEHSGVHVTQRRDDPLALRISIGRAHGLQESAYCVFRGNRAECATLLRRALEAITAGEKETP